MKHKLAKIYLLGALLLASGLGLNSCVTTSGATFPLESAPLITIGMDAFQVKEILGEPYIVERYTGGEKWIWVYATKEFSHSFVVTIEEEEVHSLSEFNDYHQ